MMGHSRTVFFLAFVTALSPLLACATTSGSGAGIDRQRDGALAVFVNRKVNDSINVPDGDDVDWKFVDINKNGIMSVAISFDDPDRVSGEVVLRDNFATVIERRVIKAGRTFYAFEPFNAIRGRYYIEVRGLDGASVYTIGVALEEPKFGVSVIPVNPLAPTEDRGGGRTFKSGGGKKVEGDAKKIDSEGGTPPEADAKPEGGGDQSGTIGVSGNIRRITPVEDGGSLLTVCFGNNGDLILAGTGGSINGLGARVVMRGRSGRCGTAYTSVESEDLVGYKAVTFSVKAR
jgi:hypothetical protein